MICSQCNRENPEGSKFCSYCGAVISQVVVTSSSSTGQTKKCPYCSEIIFVDAKKCKHCGEILDPILKASRVPPKSLPPQRLWNPGIAALLSLIIPGAGQMYRGNIGIGILWLIFVTIGYFMFIIPGIILHLICIITAASGDPYTEGG
jgi:hypothetical protein